MYIGKWFPYDSFSYKPATYYHWNPMSTPVDAVPTIESH